MTRNSWNGVRIVYGGLLVLIAVGFLGCEVLQSGAPAVTPAMTRVASADGVSVEALETGRRLLAMRCAGCHSLEPVANYTPREWKDNVRDMADRSGLNPEEEQQIVEYLSAARKSLDLELDPSSR